MVNLIAHINSFGKKQSILEHCENVSRICSIFCDSIGFKNTGKILGYLHDMGKCRDSFTEYLIKSYMSNQDESIKVPAKSDHSTIGAKFIYKYNIEENSISKLYKEIIAQVVMSHHTGLNNFIDINGNEDFLNRLNRNFEYEEECIENFYKYIIEKEEFEKLFNKGLEEIKVFMKNCNKRYDISNLINFLFAALIDADRLDAFNFDLNLEYEEQENKFIDYSKNLEKYIKKFKVNNEIDKLRSEISNICLEKSSLQKGIYDLTVPVGGGKTISSMRFALNHAIKHKKERIIYIMPYISIIEQNAEVIKKATGSNLLEFHSNVIRDEEKIWDFKEYINSRKKKTYEDRWDNDLIFTSLVQFLNVFYSKPTRNNRRLNSLKNSVIVFDEVQSIPYYTRTLFFYAIGFLEKYLNTTILLMTATQPKFNEDLIRLGYKEPIKLIENEEKYFEKFKRVNILDKTENILTREEDVNRLIEEEIKDVSSILFIVNTKRTVDFVKNSISSDEYEVITLNTNFCPEHRSEIIKETKKKLKDIQDKKRDKKLIMISTQLIEAGVDISFEKVIRSLSSLTSIAQSSGRCNRNKEREIADVIIVNFSPSRESLKNLKDIQKGKNIMKDLLAYGKEIENFDYLSKASLDEYFKCENDEIDKKEYDFIFKNTTLSDLFSINNDGKNSNKPGAKKLVLNSAIKDVKENFYVIEENNKSIIVPYKEGEDIIENLNSQREIPDIKKILQKSQRYSLNIYENTFKDLVEKGAIYELKIEGIYALVSTYYGENGLDLEGENVEDFIF